MLRRDRTSYLFFLVLSVSLISYSDSVVLPQLPPTQTLRTSEKSSVMGKYLLSLPKASLLLTDRNTFQFYSTCQITELIQTDPNPSLSQPLYKLKFPKNYNKCSCLYDRYYIGALLSIVRKSDDALFDKQGRLVLTYQSVIRALVEYSVGFPDILVEIDSKYLKFELCNKNTLQYTMQNGKIKFDKHQTIYGKNNNPKCNMFGFRYGYDDVAIEYLLNYENYRMEENGDISIFRQFENEVPGSFWAVRNSRILLRKQQ